MKIKANSTTPSLPLPSYIPSPLIKLAGTYFDTMIKRNIRNPRAYKPAQNSGDVIFPEPGEYLHPKGNKQKEGRASRRHLKQAAGLAAEAANEPLSSDYSAVVRASHGSEPHIRVRSMDGDEGEKEKKNGASGKGTEASTRGA